MKPTVSTDPFNQHSISSQTQPWNQLCQQIHSTNTPSVHTQFTHTTITSAVSSGNLLTYTYVNQPFPSPAVQSDAVKYACFWQTTLQIFYALTLRIMFSKNNLFIARLPGITANLNENYRRKFLSFSNISRNFRKIPEIYNRNHHWRWRRPDTQTRRLVI